jgi:hypothetical protein
MNTQTISKDSGIGSSLFIGSQERTNFLWENLIIERSISVNWIYKIYKNSILNDLLNVLSSPAE